MQVDTVSAMDDSHCFPLLQLPGPALSSVLQQLPICSRARTAAVCSKLCSAAEADSNSLTVTCRSVQAEQSLRCWLESHGSSLTQCSITAEWPSRWAVPVLTCLPAPQLRQLQLSGTVRVRLAPDPEGNCQGVLRGCRQLTSLSLNCYVLESNDVVTAEVSALPELKCLELVAAQDQCAPSLGQLPSDCSTFLSLTQLKVV